MNASRQLIQFVNPLEGWQDRTDPTKAQGFAVMRNVILSDRGGVSTRPGIELFGAASTGNPIISGHTAIKRDGTNVMLRSHGKYLEYYNRDTESWATLKREFTSGQVFGFGDHNVNTDQIDYVYFCNAVEPYQRWTMAFDKTTAALSGGETNIPIGSTLATDVYYSNTAVSVSTTSIAVALNTWANDIWNTGFYVRITDGTSSGTVRDITDTTHSEVTFAAIPGLTGTPTFEIRRLKFPSTGTVIVNDTTVAYTAISTDSALPVTSAPAAASGSPVAAVPEELMSNSCPRGNILTVLFQQMYVSGVKAYPSVVYRSKLNNAANFESSATRVAGEGDVVEFPGDGPIYDHEVYENQLAVFMESAVHQLTYTQDADDIAQKQPLVKSPYIGTKGRVNRMLNDIAFVNPSKEITTLSRVPFRDVRPLPSNIAWPIKTAMRDYGTDAARLINYRNYMMTALKTTTNSSNNDVMILFDNVYERWIGEWDLSIADFVIYDNDLYGMSAASNETYKMLTDRTAQVKGTTVIGYDTEVETQWVNRTQSGIDNQFFTQLAVRGYIKTNTQLNFELSYDFAVEPTHTWVFDPATAGNDIVLGDEAEEVLGVSELGVTPIAFELGEEESIYGERPFYVVFRLPATIHAWTKLAWTTSGADTYFDIIDIMANFTPHTENVSQKRMLSIESAS